MPPKKRQPRTEMAAATPAAPVAAAEPPSDTVAAATSASSAATTSVVVNATTTQAASAPNTAVSPSVPASATTTRVATAVAVPPAEEDEAALYFYASAKCKVVGIQHYRGLVSKKEMLILERDPLNPYDKNAIAVMNANGEKVGHIPRDVAAFLAPFVDSEELEVEAMTGTSTGGTYTLPITVSIFCTNALKTKPNFSQRFKYYFPSIISDAASVEAAGGLAGGPRLSREAFAEGYNDVFTRLSAGAEGDPFAGLDLNDASLKPTEAFKGTLLPYQAQGVAWLRHHEMPRVVDFSHVISGEEPLTRRKSSKTIVAAATASAASTGDTIDASSASAAPIAPKRSRSGTVLTKAQEKANALAAAAAKEREATAWFWKEVAPGAGCCGPTEYINVLTNFTSREKPLMPRGGLLGDAMGLGKTVQMLAVMSHRIEVSSSSGGVGTSSSAASSASSPAPTLIVCPLSLLTHWEDHITQFLPSFTAVVYHGSTRSASSLATATVDVVITTYSTLASEGANSPLQKKQWGRVLLDEAHNIKSAKSQAAKACTSLKSIVRWCVTGTPLQNSLGDLQSLIAFLHIEPFCEAKWWQALLIRPMRSRDPRGLERLRCLLRAITLRRTKDTKGPDGQLILQLPPISITDRIVPMTTEEKEMYSKLKQVTKARIEKLSGSGSGSDAANTNTTAYAEALVLLLRLRQLCNHPHLIPQPILDALKESSASDDASALMKRMNTLSEEKLTAFAELLMVAADETCSICLEPITNAAVTHCRHLFCFPCIKGYLQTIYAKEKAKLGGTAHTKTIAAAVAANGACPNCRGKLSIALTAEDEFAKQFGSGGANGSAAAAATDAFSSSSSSPAAGVIAPISSKVQAVKDFVLEELQKPLPPDDANPQLPRKVVIFSQWPSMLNILAQHLQILSLSSREGGSRASSSSPSSSSVRCVSLTGSMTSEQRQAAVTAFAKDPTVRVMLLSTMAGSVGLNLVAASACVLVDPWWNPSIDQQAIMRVHRIGQKRPVTVVRLAMCESVEVNIWDLQRKKQALFEGAFGGSEEDGAAAAAGKKKGGAGLSFDELRQFFR